MNCLHPDKYFAPVLSPALPKGCMANKVALVTGGGTGLGKAIATNFAYLGARVAIAARRLDVLEKTAAEIRKETGGICDAFQMDVKSEEIVSDTLDKIQAKYGEVPNILVNNAAGNFIMATERLSANAVKTVVDIVLLGTINVTRQVARRAMQEGRGCAVLSITTPYSRGGGPFVLPSAVSKAGVENMSRSLATEWAKHGFRFNVIAPGPIPTEGAMGRLSHYTLEESTKMAAKTVPEGRCGTPEELANLTSFVCSDFGNWINGAIIDFDGGQQHANHGSSMGHRLHQMKKEDWDAIEDTIRKRTGKDKSKL